MNINSSLRLSVSVNYSKRNMGAYAKQRVMNYTSVFSE